MRLDKYLYENKFAESRQKAVYLINAGNVFVNGRQVFKHSTDINNENIKDVVEIRGEVMPYVSRGGLKLEAALREFNIDCNGLVCADIGASTGGFTDCLIQNGAKKVYAIDCGTDQLYKKLRNNPRIISIENFNARNLDIDIIGEMCDLVVLDVSFISQTLIIPNVIKILKTGGTFISLIKPQFEAGRDNNINMHDIAIKKVIDCAAMNNLTYINHIRSPILGGDGNIEYLGKWCLNN